MRIDFCIVDKMPIEKKKKVSSAGVNSCPLWSILLLGSSLVVTLLSETVDAFHSPSHQLQLERRQDHVRKSSTRSLPSRSTNRLSPLYIFTYGRGADIWPECNEDPVQLTDSFPNGQIPYSAIMAMDQQDMAAVHTSVQESITSSDGTSEEADMVETGGKQGKRRRRNPARFLVSKTVRRLLRRAAAKEELDIEQATLNENPGIWTQILSVVPVLLVIKGLISPLDVMAVASFTTYYMILQMIARSPRDGGMAPIMPAVPPQGHVPIMVSNPLGIGTLYSAAYERWLQLGIALGFVAPVIQLVHQVFRANDIDAARLCARPIFLLCCQALSEAYSRRVMVCFDTSFVSLSFVVIWLFSLSPTQGTVTHSHFDSHFLQCTPTGISLELGQHFPSIGLAWASVGDWQFSLLGS